MDANIHNQSGLRLTFRSGHGKLWRMLPVIPEDRALRKDLKTLAIFIHIYCKHKHAQSPRKPAKLNTHDVEAIARQPVEVCESCFKLLAHAFTKRSHCPMDPKPACKHCPNHCYHPTYRAQIQEVMRFSGKKLLFTGRLDYLFHLLF